MWIAHNCWISFCHFLDIVNLVIFHPEYIDIGYYGNICNPSDVIVMKFWHFFKCTSTAIHLGWMTYS